MEDPVISRIKNQFDKKGNPAKIPLMSGKQFFEARAENDGIYVDNLKNQPFLPWRAFYETVNFLQKNGGKAKKGNATGSRLGDPNLDLNTVEGYIASEVYGCKTGETVFKRITSIASILDWAEICENTRGQLVLLTEKEGREKGEFINALNIQLLKKDSELNSLETKLSESLQRIEELEEQVAGRDREIATLKEGLEAKT